MLNYNLVLTTVIIMYNSRQISVAMVVCLLLVVPVSTPVAAELTSAGAAPQDAVNQINLAQTEPVSPPVTETFEDGTSGWTIDLHPNVGPRVTKGQGEWSTQHGGSIHLSVDGGPNHIGVYRQVDGLSEGTQIRAEYESPNLDGEPGSPRILLHPPDSDEVIGLDSDKGRGQHNGTLVGTVPRDLPDGTEVEIRLGVWPGQIDVFVTNIEISQEESGTQQSNSGGSEKDQSTSQGVTSISSPFTEEFDNNRNGWELDLYPDTGDRVSKGTGEWTSRHGGSVHLSVDGGPNHIGIYRPVDGLSEGTQIRAEYESPNLDGEPGSPRILLHLPDSDEVIGLDSDKGRGQHNGTLVGTVPRDLPDGTEVEIRLGVWPGEIDVFVTSISVGDPDSDRSVASDSDSSAGSQDSGGGESSDTEDADESPQIGGDGSSDTGGPDTDSSDTGSSDTGGPDTGSDGDETPNTGSDRSSDTGGDQTGNTDANSDELQQAAREMALKNQKKYAEGEKQFTTVYWANQGNEKMEKSIEVFLPDYTDATVSVLDEATQTKPGATGGYILDGMESSAYVLGGLHYTNVGDFMRDANTRDIHTTYGQLRENSQKIKNRRDVNNDGVYDDADRRILYEERKVLLERAYRSLILFEKKSDGWWGPLDFNNDRLRQSTYTQARQVIQLQIVVLYADYQTTTSWLNDSPSSEMLPEATGEQFPNENINAIDKGDVDTLETPDDYALYRIDPSSDARGWLRELVIRSDGLGNNEDLDLYLSTEPIDPAAPMEAANVQHANGSDLTRGQVWLVQDGKLNRGETYYVLVQSDVPTTYRLFSSSRGSIAGLISSDIDPELVDKREYSD